MAKHTFDIQYNDASGTVTFEDDMAYGKFSEILKQAVDLSKVLSGDIKINIPLYQDLIIQNAITDAPFNPNKETLDKMGRRLHDKIVKEILSHYPLGDSLESWATAMLGDEEQIKSLIKSMPSVLSNSDGTRTQ